MRVRYVVNLDDNIIIHWVKRLNANVSLIIKIYNIVN